MNLPLVIRRTCALKHAGVTATVSPGERLHHAVDLLSLAGQPKAPQELPESLNQVQVCELVQLQEGMQNLDVEVVSAQHAHNATQGHTRGVNKKTTRSRTERSWMRCIK